MLDLKMDSNRTVNEELSLFIRAKFPIISIASYEEGRIFEQLMEVRDEVVRKRKTSLEDDLNKNETTDEEKKHIHAKLNKLSYSHQIIRWSYSMGLYHWSRYEEEKHWPKKIVIPYLVHHDQDKNPDRNPVSVIEFILNHSNEIIEGVDFSTGIYVFCDLHPWLDREDRMGRFNHLLVRYLRDIAQRIRYAREPKTIILLSPENVIPRELNKDIVVIDYPLPTKEEHEKQFNLDIEQIKKNYGNNAINLVDKDQKDQKDAFVSALCGLTIEEAKNVIAKSLHNNKKITADDIKEILREKRQIIEKDGMLEYFDSDTTYDEVGGLELLRKWLDQRKEAFVGQKFYIGEVDISLPIPKGILLIGVPGGGKSLMAKAVANAWKLPLLRLDIGKIYGGIVGQSEANMRRVIKIAESVSPSIVWLDEVEKAFPQGSSSGDSGVSLRVMNTFLTWMQEKTKPVFVVATGNDISKLPPELTRKGRFDEIFWVGLPDFKARVEIFKIKTKGLPLNEEDLKILAIKAKCYTGAEIEQAVKNGKYRYFDMQKSSKIGATETIAQSIIECMANFVPHANRKDEKTQKPIYSSIVSIAREIACKASENFEPLPGETVSPAQADEPLQDYRWKP